jgi:class 3 adenylate cyclase/streptogramin lyase
MLREGGKRVLATVLFTDIVGSTDLAVELGDGRWRGLIARHHVLLSRELKAFDGRLVDTAGDGVFAIFSSPANAVRCAAAIAAAVRQLGIEIRAGVHTGEVEIDGKQPRGVGVHVGARVMANASAGEVLTTSTVHDLVAGSGLSFDEAGGHELKGVPGTWQLWRLATVDGVEVATPLDGDEAHDIRSTIQARTSPPRRTVARSIVVAFTIVAAAGITLIVLERGEDTLRPGVNTIARIDVSKDAFDHVTDSNGVLPTGIGCGEDGDLWVINRSTQTLTRVDATTLVAGSPTSTKGAPTAIAAGEGNVWVANGYGGASGSPQVVRIDPNDGLVSKAFQAPSSSSIVVAFGSIWVADPDGDRVLRYDPRDLVAPPDRIPIDDSDEPSGPSFLAIGTGAASGIWVVNVQGNTVVRIDPDATDHLSVFSVDRPTAVAASGPDVWITSEQNDSVTRLDATTQRPIDTLTLADAGVPNGPTDIVVARDGVWVASDVDHAVSLIDPTTDRVVERLPVAGIVGGMTIDNDGNVWVTVRAQ